MKPVAITRAQLQDNLQTILFVSANWATPNIHLSTANIDPDPHTTLAVLAAGEVTDSWYGVTSPQNWGDGFATGNIETSFWTQSYSYFTPNPSIAIYTWYLTDATNAKLLCSGRFPNAPIGLSENGQIVMLLLQTGLGRGAMYVSP